MNTDGALGYEPESHGSGGHNGHSVDFLAMGSSDGRHQGKEYQEANKGHVWKG